MIDIKTCKIPKEKHVDPIRTTPRMCDWPIQEPIEKFIANLNK